MKVKLKTLYSSSKKVAQAGQVIEVDDKEGKELIKGGYAIELDPPRIEKAVRKPVETAKKKKSKKARK